MKPYTFFLILLSFNPSLNAECAWQTSFDPLYEPESEDTIYQVIDEPMNPEFWMLSKPSEPILDDYRKWVEAKINPEPFALLQRQRNIFAASLFKDHLPKFDKIITQEVGLIRDANCIELLLFAKHAKRFPRGEVDTEFNARILENDATKRMKIYFASGHHKDGMAPSLSRFNDETRQDIKNGFRVVYALHNHYFCFENETGDLAGTTLPSDPDIQTFTAQKDKFGLEKIGITNGISSIEMPTDDFQKLKPH